MDPRVAARMSEHVREVAAEHGIRLTWIKSWRQAIAFHETKHAYVPEITHPSDYLFALHEVGHLASPDSLEAWDGEGGYSSILCEGAAWAWAATTARPALTRHLRAKDWDLVAYAYRTYLQSRGEAA